MGGLRILVETTMREVILLLHRDGVPSASIKRVSNRIASLQRDIVDSERYHSNKGIDVVEAQEICSGIMGSIVARVLDAEIPDRTVKALEMEVRCLNQTVRAAEKERDGALRQIEEAKKIERRHSDAHMYALHCYFREVFQLRQVIQHNQSVAPAPQHAQPHHHLALNAAHLGVVAPHAPAAASCSDATSSSPAQHRLSLGRSQLGASTASVFVDIPVQQDVSPNAATRSTPPNGLLRVQSLKFPALRGPPSDGVSSSPTAPLEHSTAVAGTSVQQEYCTDAIFDYERYLDLQRSDELAWEAKYYQLNDDYNAYIQQVDKDKLHTEKVHAEVVSRQHDRYNALMLRFRTALDQFNMAKLLVSGVTRAFREERDKLKDDVLRIQAGLMDSMQKLNRHVTDLSTYNQVLVDFVRAATKYMGEQSASVTKDTSSKVEEIARFRFQRSLAPAPGDAVNTREAKLFWRRHELSNVVFATVMEQRQMHEERIDAVAAANELRVMVKQLQKENADALEQRVAYGFVGLQTLLSVASQTPQLSAHGGIGTSSANTAAVLPHRDMPISVITERSKSTAYIAIPQTAKWLLRGGKGGLPTIAPAGELVALQGIVGAENVPVGPLYLRRKTPEGEVEAMVHDRRLMHQVFTCGRDPAYYLRDDDRDAILRGWRQHMMLVHERNYKIFQRILVRIMHRHLTEFVDAMLADTTKRAVGIQGGGTAAMLRTDVLQWREAVEQLKTCNREMEVYHQSVRQTLTRAIVDNSVWMLRNVEKHVVDHLRGLFPPTLRAHRVPDAVRANELSAAEERGGANRRVPKRSQSNATRKSTTQSQVFGEDSVDWRSNGLECASTQTQVSGFDGVVQSRGGRRPLYTAPHSVQDPSNVRHDNSNIVAGQHRYLTQSMHQFSTTTEQDDESSTFFQVASLEPPRCIAIPTTGGVGLQALNRMSIQLLAKTSLMTTSPQMQKELDATAAQLVVQQQAATTPTARGVHHTPLLTAPQQRPASGRVGGDMTTTTSFPKRCGSATILTSPRGTSASSRSSVGRSLLGAPAPPPGPRGGGSASTRLLHSASSTSTSPSRISSAARRVTSLPPAVYE